MLNWGKREYQENGADWHESGVSVDNIGPDFNPICTRIEQVQQKEIGGLPEFEREHVLRALKMGKAWLIEPLQELQPKSFAVLDEFASEFKLAFNWYDRFMRRPPVITNMLAVGWIEVCGRVIALLDLAGRHTMGNYEDNYGGDPRWLYFEQALPEAIGKSWIWRVSGWSILSNLPGDRKCNQLVGVTTNYDISDLLYMRYRKKEQKNVMARLADKIPRLIMTRKRMDDTEYDDVALKMFLDTRPGGYDGPNGDQLLVIAYTTERVVYHVHDGDVQGIRILRNPEEAIDAYCAHTLLRAPGRFDFMPWSEPLK